jgi:hypothetical protein
LILPLAFYGGLAILRPGELGELINPWVRELAQSDPVALTSSSLLACVVVALWRLGRARPRSCRHAGQIAEGS